MGYFPNGTSGDMYQAEYCNRCVHWPEDPADGGCEVWFLHMLHNYDECNNPESMLHKLIPRREDGWNAECTMFWERGQQKQE